jgi:hypothetical protein
MVKWWLLAHIVSIVLGCIVVFSQVFHHHTNLSCFSGLGMMKELFFFFFFDCSDSANSVG